MPLMNNALYFLLSFLQGIGFESLAISCALAIDAGVIFSASPDKADIALLYPLLAEILYHI